MHELLLSSKGNVNSFSKELFIVLPVSVDLRVSRIYRHLAASPLFGGQTAGAGGTPRLSYLPSKDGDAARWR